MVRRKKSRSLILNDESIVIINEFLSITGAYVLIIKRLLGLSHGT